MAELHLTASVGNRSIDGHLLPSDLFPTVVVLGPSPFGGGVYDSGSTGRSALCPRQGALESGESGIWGRACGRSQQTAGSGTCSRDWRP